jgi:diguanylate cyclase (GGDEF)-like protein
VLIAAIHALPLLYDHPPSAFSGELMVALPVYVLLAVGGLRTKRIRYGLWARAESLSTRHAAVGRVATEAVAGSPPAAFYRVVAEETGRLLEATASALVRFAGDEAEIVGSWGPPGPVPLGPGTHFTPAPDSDLTRMRTLRRPVASPHQPPGSFAYSLGWRAMVLAPVVVGDEVWGALVALHKEPWGLPGDAEERLLAFTEVLGLAIAGAEDRAQLAAQAATDSLTGLLNRRVVHDALARETSRSRRHGRSLTLVLIDVDFFKQLNDSAGHEAGDATLAALADALRDAARIDDVLGRVGGDELAWLMPETDTLPALAAVERLRQDIHSRDLGGARLTFSAGICGIEHATSAEELFRCSDAALYWSKANGRDAAWIYDPEVIGGLSDEDRARNVQRSQALLGLRALARAIDAKDHTTREHSERVAELVVGLAAARGWPPSRQALLRETALVHDVGKIGIPDAILLKAGRLTPEEYEVVKEHSELGARIAEEVLRPEQVGWIRTHHERPDGRGYPQGMGEAEISEGAALLAVADAWDVMTRSRSYSVPKPEAEAREECRALIGAQFTAQAVEALEAALSSPASTVSASA